jgi:hypothetical protein
MTGSAGGGGCRDRHRPSPAEPGRDRRTADDELLVADGGRVRDRPRAPWSGVNVRRKESACRGPIRRGGCPEGDDHHARPPGAPAWGPVDGRRTIRGRLAGCRTVLRLASVTDRVPRFSDSVRAAPPPRHRSSGGDRSRVRRRGSDRGGAGASRGEPSVHPGLSTPAGRFDALGSHAIPRTASPPRVRADTTGHQEKRRHAKEFQDRHFGPGERCTRPPASRGRSRR